MKPQRNQIKPAAFLKMAAFLISTWINSCGDWGSLASGQESPVWKTLDGEFSEAVSVWQSRVVFVTSQFETQVRMYSANDGNVRFAREAREGTGFLLDPSKGLVVTLGSIVGQPGLLVVEYSDGSLEKGIYGGVDEKSGLGFFRVSPRRIGNPVEVRASSSRPSPGSFGLLVGHERVVGSGIRFGMFGMMKSEAEINGTIYDELCVLHVESKPEDMGGLLLSASGPVGIVLGSPAREEVASHPGFAATWSIPLGAVLLAAERRRAESEVAPDADELTSERQEPSWLGIRGRDLFAKEFHEIEWPEDVPWPDENSGVRIEVVVIGSCADDAGLNSEDVITRWDGRWVRGIDDLISLVERTIPGRELRLEVLRQGALKEVAVVMGSW